MIKQDLETFSLEITKNLSTQVKELEQKFAQAGQAVTSVAQELQKRAGKQKVKRVQVEWNGDRTRVVVETE